MLKAPPSIIVIVQKPAKGMKPKQIINKKPKRAPQGFAENMYPGAGMFAGRFMNAGHSGGSSDGN